MSRMVTAEDLEKHNVPRTDKPWHLKIGLPKFLKPGKTPPRSRGSSPQRSPGRTPPRSRQSSPQRASQPNNLYIPIDFTKNIPENIPYPPFINVEGVPNFRDIGGYACNRPPTVPADVDLQFSVRRDYIFRCSELSQISAVGLVTLIDTLKIMRQYDLRSEREAARPEGQPAGVHCISTPVFRKGDVTHEMAVQQLTWSTAPDVSPDAGYSQGYVYWYRQILQYGAKSAYRKIFEHIRDRPDEPVLFHCTAGKDRTGVLTAVILHLCGVDNKTIAWEYSLTVPGMGVWEEAVEQEMVGDSMMPIRKHGGMTKEEARRVCGSRASNMEKFIEIVLEGEFGGARQYLKEECQFSEEDINTICEHLINPGEATVKPISFPGYDEHVQT